MVTRVQGVRRQLRQRLEALVPAYNWESITQQVSHYMSSSSSFQVGMFWFSGLSEAQGMALADHHVYVMPSKTFTLGQLLYFPSSGNGRMNLCGVNPSNIEHLANALAAVVTTVK